MVAFFGIERRLSLTASVLAFVGWLMFIVGFILQEVLVSEYIVTGLGLFPWIVFAAGAPFSFIIKLCYAGRSDLGSSVCGIFFAFTSLSMLASMGYVFMFAVGLERAPGIASLFNAIGSFICIHCWCVNLVTTTLYKDYDTSELEANVEARLHKRLFQGAARKLAILPGIFLAIEYILIEIGLPGIVYPDDFTDHFNIIRDGSNWGVNFFGVLAIAFIFVHAGSWGSSSRTLGAVTAYMVTIYMVLIGTFFYYSMFLLSSYEDYSTPLTFVGCLFTCFSMACILSLWPFYERLGSWTLPVASPQESRAPLLEGVPTDTQPLGYNTAESH